MSRHTKDRLDKKYQELNKLVKHFTGYPVNASFDYSQLYRFLELPINNVGDAHAHSNYQLNTHDFETEVIRFLAELYGKPEHYWGYITNGGSEGNLCGLHIARNRFPSGMVYYSDHSHYSVPKAISITRSDAECLPTEYNGEISYTALDQALAKNKDRPALIMANMGTTMTGAVDDLRKIKALLQKHSIHDYHIHCDGALHGLILPFCDMDTPITLDDFDSISISGHKFLGSPLPCGIFLTHKHIIEKQQQFVEYVQIHDNTLTGSRNAITPLIIWYAIHENGRGKLQQVAQSCIAMTEYAVNKMQQAGIAAWANPYSPIAVFPRPSDTIIEKWQLAPYQDIAHIVTVGHITQTHVDEIVADLVREQTGEAIDPESQLTEPQLSAQTKSWLGVGSVIVALSSVIGLSMLD